MKSNTLWMYFTGLVLIITVVPSFVYGQNFAQCGRRKTRRIVGGTTTFVNEFPMMAGVVQTPTPAVFCGAIIINNYFAVSAAHCFSKRVVSRLRLLVGDHDFDVGYDTPYAEVYRFAYVYAHPQYNSNTDQNDIAVLKTSTQIQFNVAVGPVCLPTGNNLYENRIVEAVGWGTTSYGGVQPSALQKVTLRVIPQQSCVNYYGSKITYSQICTYEYRKDSCQLDSGGPIFLYENGVVYLVGIISYGTSCGSGAPSVNTRITYYADWIRYNTR